jgi:HAD superfamily hydrolase (TIGR01509 family)
VTVLCVEGVIFDVDGTLADTLEYYYGMACDFVELAGAPPVSRERVFGLMGRGDRDLLRKLFPADFPDLDAALARVVRERLGFWLRRMSEETEPLEGCVDLLHRLHSGGWRLGIATSSPRSLPFLDRWGVRHVFDSIVGREDVSHRKPHPESILRCVTELGVQTAEAVYVGDSPIDIEAGRAAGVRTIGVLTGTSRREVLAGVSPDYILESAAELGDLLTRSGGCAPGPDGSSSPGTAA